MVLLVLLITFPSSCVRGFLDSLLHPVVAKLSVLGAVTTCSKDLRTPEIVDVFVLINGSINGSRQQLI